MKAAVIDLFGQVEWKKTPPADAGASLAALLHDRKPSWRELRVGPSLT